MISNMKEKKQQSKKLVDPTKFYQNKKLLITFLIKTGLYVPKEKDCTAKFLKKVLMGEKKLFKINEIVMTHHLL